MRIIRCVLFGLAFLCAPVWAADRPNVLLVTVDTFRPDQVSAYGCPRKTSPYLDQLAGDGVLFEHAISSSSWTSPGLISILTGLWAPTHGVDVRGKSLAPGTPTMPLLLRKAGYAAPDILYLSAIPNFSNLGLTRSYVDRDKYLPNGDDVLFRALEAYRDSTFFLYYHYRNLHLPYKSAPAFDHLYTPKHFDRSAFIHDKVKIVQDNVEIPLGSVTFDRSDRPWIVGLYDGQVREMDETLFKPLIAELKRLGIYEKTLVIVTADHGEELLDHGFIGHPSTSRKGSAYDELIHIPLIMSCPMLLPKGRRVAQQVQNIDILPTVLDLIGLPVPKSLQGRSLAPLIRGEVADERPAFTETTPGGYQSTPEMMKTRIRAMRTSDWKLINTHGPGVDRYELYDLKGDPGEQHNVANGHPEVLARMQVALHRWVLASQAAAIPAPSEAPGTVPSAPIRVVFPADGDTLRYTEADKAVSVRWTGPEDALYTLEYRVGRGNYHIEGTMPIRGTTPTYGPFTEEMWNMLGLYNPYSFRVVVGGKPELNSPWVHFTILPTADAVLPSRWMRLRGAIAFGWREGALLVGGIGLSLLDLLRLVADIPPVDVISAALMLAIVGGIAHEPLKRLGPDRSKCWGLAAGWVGFIYATLSSMPKVWRTLWAHTQGRIDMAGSLVTAAALLAMAVFLVVRCRRVLPFLGLVVLVGAYAWLLLHLGTSPAERFHLAEYGLLAFFLFRAFRLDFSPPAAYALALGLAICLGGCDEFIQWILPNRIFEWKDIGLNAVSSGLGLIAVAMLRSSRS